LGVSEFRIRFCACFLTMRSFCLKSSSVWPFLPMNTWAMSGLVALADWPQAFSLTGTCLQPRSCWSSSLRTLSNMPSQKSLVLGSLGRNIIPTA